MKNVFIIGSKGIPSSYGGFETFVDELTERKKSDKILYHIACLGNKRNEFYHNNARCFTVKVPDIGSSKAVLYDLLSMQECIRYIKQNNLSNCVVYILACRIGPLIFMYKKMLERLNVNVYVNPDGHEWLRSKWSTPVKRYWKLSERLMVKKADLIVCDSHGIESYIKRNYSRYQPKTTFIPYGADITKSILNDDSDELLRWYNRHGIHPNKYYLIVGRFVPENNYEVMIREFMNSKTQKDLVIISNVQHNEFYKHLLEKTKFNEDKRIKFIGTLYDYDLLKKIRENAYGYIHGHEVGGTNPSLLEALASTEINLLLDVKFNKEVGLKGAVYFNKELNNLSNLIKKTDDFTDDEIKQLKTRAQNRIIDHYSWDKVVSEYEKVFLK